VNRARGGLLRILCDVLRAAGAATAALYGWPVQHHNQHRGATMESPNPFNVYKRRRPVAKPAASDPHATHITVTEGMRGWFAVMMHWVPDDGGFWEPVNSHPNSNAAREGAVLDAQEWAAAEEVECRV
jgi:hypothetical protein